jgi:hypothetical protein
MCRKKNVRYEVEMCDDQLRCFLVPDFFLVIQEVDFPKQVQFPTSPKYFRFPELLYSAYIICMVVGKSIVLVPNRM